MSDRRDPTRQALHPGGRRAYDPPLSTGDCARAIGVDTAFIIGEIEDRRLKAMHTVRPGGRRLFRVYAEDFLAYVRAHWSHDALPRAQHYLASRTKPLRPTEAVERPSPAHATQRPEPSEPA
jgi:hypothetical protein